MGSKDNRTKAHTALTVIAVLLVIALAVTILITPIINASHDRKKAIIEQDAKPVNAAAVSIGTASGYEEIFNELLKVYGYTESSFEKEKKLYANGGDSNRDVEYGFSAPNVISESASSADGGLMTGAENDSVADADITGSADSNAPMSADSAIAKDENSPVDFSDTNNQVEGVQEADIIKSDGKYIYAINSEQLNIIEANGANPKLVASVKQLSDKGETYFEMALTKTRLIAIKEGYDKNYADEESKSKIGEYDYNRGNRITGIDVFDITDPTNPEKLNSLTQSGSYNESRVVGDALYLISDYDNMNIMSIQKDKPTTYVPCYTKNSSRSMAAPEDILMPPERNGGNYTIISGIDISGKGDFVSKKSVFGNYPTIYASEKNIYLATQDWGSKKVNKKDYTIITESTNTIFTRLSINKGEVELEASSRVPGFVLNQFSMDEYKDVLRTVMTNDRYTYTEYRGPGGAFYDNMTEGYDGSDNVTTNSVYTLDMDLNILGSITGLAEDERIYSARFTGDTAYFVTFRETDPLFSVDLSDPKKPKILSALKIPGFSDYLHPYDEGLLFGIGEERTSDGSGFMGVKLSMFDNSDPADVTEKSKLVLSEYSYTAVSESHKAILVNGGKSLIAFPADGDYVICNYGKDGFNVVKKIRLELDDYGGADEYYGYIDPLTAIRGMFIEDYFYVISPRSVTVFDMKDDYKRVGGMVTSKTAVPVNRYAYEWGVENNGYIFEGDIVYGID